jgi:hypothetical protein
MSRTTSGAEVCALIGVFGITVWAGAIAVVVAAARRRRCCPQRCPCRAEDYLDSAEDGLLSMSPTPSGRYTMPIQRGGDSGKEF